MPVLCDVWQTFLMTCHWVFHYPCGFRWVRSPRCWVEWPHWWEPKIKCDWGQIAVVYCRGSVPYPCIQKKLIHDGGLCYRCSYIRVECGTIFCNEYCCEDGKEYLVNTGLWVSYSDTLGGKEGERNVPTGSSDPSYFLPGKTISTSSGTFEEEGSCVAAVDEVRPGVTTSAGSLGRLTTSAVRRGSLLGLGDVISALSLRLGIRPCTACKARAAYLNARVPFKIER